MKIEQIDGNFRVKTGLDRPDICFRNALEAPFRVSGLLREDGRFVRIPSAVAKAANEGVVAMNICTAGGQVRFVTDSPYIAVAVQYNEMLKMPHFAYTGSIAFDLYADGRYINTYITAGDDPEFEGVIDLPEAGTHVITLHFPLYSGVNELFIGLAEGAALLPPPARKTALPVVFYGSSITQGGCASRPGNAYDNIIARLLDCEHTNLGFSGSARGEQVMADYLAALPMHALVYDYDHNAPTAEHLQATHEAMFRTIRAAQPKLPVIMLSRPIFHLTEDEKRRVAIIRATYENARAAGDQNVWFIPGPELIEEPIRETATVDNCHPNDSGFVSMAYAVAKVLKECL